METYETIGVAVRQHDAIRLSVKAGEPATYYIAAEWVPRLFGRRTVPIYRLRLAGDYVMPERIEAGSASISSTGKSVVVSVGYDQMLIPTRQLEVHYGRNLGETSKIIRRVEAEVSAAASPCAPAAPVAVV